MLKLPSSPPGPAAARGLEMHDRASQYIMGQIDDLEPPTQMFGAKRPVLITDKYREVLDEFKNHPNGERYSEHKLSFDDGWYLVGPMSPKAWCVGVLDAARGYNGVVHIGEWKSGSPKNTHADQRKLYALFGLRRWLVDEVRVTTFYFEDTAPPDRLVVRATAESKLQSLWQGRVEQMKNDNICAPKPGDQCRWCDYSKAKGGPCVF